MRSPQPTGRAPFGAGPSGPPRPGALPAARSWRSPGPGPFPLGTHTRTSIYETRVAHNGLIPPFSAAACCVIPALVCGAGGSAPPSAGGVSPSPARGQFEKSVVSKE